MAPPEACALRPGEEEWQDAYNRLQERFSDTAGTKIAKALRDSGGHAGMAAAALRDQLREDKREVDPDDAEQVKTLLSNPVIFQSSCKTYFRKFDKDRNGVLDLPEVLALTAALYESFGLDAPREANVQSFFHASDANGDGVLTEQEFTSFFECFLRYAFFDVHDMPVVKKEPRAQRESSARQAKAQADHDGGGSRRGSSRVRQAVDEARSDAHKPKPAVELGSSDNDPGRRAQPKQRGEEAPASRVAMLRCQAQNGVALRRSANLADKMGDVVVNRGDMIKVQEIWIKTSEGWLPMVDAQGKALFEPAAGAAQATGNGSGAAEQERPRRRSARPEDEAPAPAPLPPRAPVSPPPPGRSVQLAAASAARGGGGGGGFQLNPGEDQEAFDRLLERFPLAGAELVANALRDHEWHAGKAARALRDMGRPGA